MAAVAAAAGGGVELPAYQTSIHVMMAQATPQQSLLHQIRAPGAVEQIGRAMAARQRLTEMIRGGVCPGLSARARLLHDEHKYSDGQRLLAV